MGCTSGVELTFESGEPHPVRTKSAKAARREKDKESFIQVSMAGLEQQLPVHDVWGPLEDTQAHARGVGVEAELASREAGRRFKFRTR